MLEPKRSQGPKSNRQQGHPGERAGRDLDGVRIELDEQVRLELAGLRDRDGPPVTVEQRMLAALELKLGGDSGPDDPGDHGDHGDHGGEPSSVPADLPALASGPKLAFAAKIAAATLAMTGAGLIVLRLAVVTVRAVAADPPPDRTAQLEPQPARPEPPPAAVQAPEQISVSVQPPPRAATPRLEKSATTGKRDAPERDDPLAAEFALLETAHAAGDPAAALAALERHRKQFPDGQLADEREVMRVEVLCTLGRDEAAREVADRFLATRPSSPLRPRVRATCPDRDN